MLRWCRQHVTKKSGVSDVLRGCYGPRGCYEETAAVEFTLNAIDIKTFCIGLRFNVAAIFWTFQNTILTISCVDCRLQFAEPWRYRLGYRHMWTQGTTWLSDHPKFWRWHGDFLARRRPSFLSNTIELNSMTTTVSVLGQKGRNVRWPRHVTANKSTAFLSDRTWSDFVSIHSSCWLVTLFAAGMRCIVMSVSVCLSVRSHISETTC